MWLPGTRLQVISCHTAWLEELGMLFNQGPFGMFSDIILKGAYLLIKRRPFVSWIIRVFDWLIVTLEAEQSVKLEPCNTPTVTHTDKARYRHTKTNTTQTEHNNYPDSIPLTSLPSHQSRFFTKDAIIQLDASIYAACKHK